ncbi:HU family DNA-binding protein [Bacillus thuringiensis]|uniref:DNA-binding protein n=1 Tax=Bacillus thuringiensis TaxID=1428 RepID=A0A9X6TNF5_BACTU|nr:DNA-binding protein [Bacillus thuringiensis]
MKSELMKQKASLTVNAVFQSIQNALQIEKNIQLIGFGTFGIREHATRKGHNPHNSEPITIPAGKTPQNYQRF